MLNMNSNLTLNKYRALGLILLLIGIVYSNTLDAGWHLDDYHNIVNNPWIHIHDLYPNSIKQTFFASFDEGDYKGENLYRPVAMASFALNWYFGHREVVGYHVVNIAVHMLAAIFLFLCVDTLLMTPNVNEKYRKSRYSIALLAAVLWAIHPIQVQGVTYIVQRMASMAGMFYIASFYAYLKARLATGNGKKAMLFLTCLILFLLAVLSKQNAVLLPLIIVSAEFIFFRKPDKSEIKKLAIVGGGMVLVFALATVLMLYYAKNDIEFLNHYSHRPFTLPQRLMTEARVIWFYCYQLVYPVSSNYSISHSIPISISLISPWTTLPAILLIFASFGAAVFFAWRTPLISFAVLFFFINHLIESTFIPLELIFEHRNYIPSMFMFVPAAAGIQNMLARYRGEPDKYLLFRVYFFLISGIIMVTAIGTYTRNFDWHTEKSLWEDTAEKVPDRPRPYQNLAVAYYLKIQDYETATELFKKALDLKGNNPRMDRMVSFSNLSRICIKQKNMEKAREYAQLAVETNPIDMSALDYISVLIDSDMLDKALSSAEEFLERKPGNKQGLEFKTSVLIRKGEFQKAEKPALALIKMEPFNLRYLFYFGRVQSELRHYEKAEYYLKKVAEKNGPDQLALHIALIDNSIMAGSEQKTGAYLEQLFQRFTLDDIKQVLERIQKDGYPLFSISSPKTYSRIRSYAIKLAQTISVSTK